MSQTGGYTISDFIRTFAPSWFASVMGTGILAITSRLYSQYVPFLESVSTYLFYFNVALFVVLLIPWILRWILFPKEAWADLEHPILSNFYATIAIAMLVLSANFIIIGNQFVAGEIFWFLGTALTLVFGVLSPYLMIKGEHVQLHHINPAWFIPPVGLIVIPMAGSLLINRYTGLLHEVVIVLNYVGWGGGFFLYLALFAIVMYRFILHPPLPNTLAPTVWINLGPIGVGTAALMNLARHSTLVTVKEPFLVFGLFFWGFGIWWVLMTILLTIHYVRKLKLPYALSWWAFTFPLGAYVAACHLIAQTFGLVIADYIGFGLYLLLVLFWLLTLTKTVLAVSRGTL